MRSASPENYPSSFPLLLTPLDFILFAEGGVPAIAQIRNSFGTLQKKLKAKKKGKTDCMCERILQLYALIL